MSKATTRQRVTQLTEWMNNKIDLMYKKIENNHRNLLKRIKSMETQVKKIKEEQKEQTKYSKSIHPHKKVINPVLLIDKINQGFIIRGDSFHYKHEFYINGGNWEKEKLGWLFKEKEALQKTLEKIGEKYTPSPKVLWN